MNLPSLSAALAQLEAARLVPYWLFQPVVEVVPRDRGVNQPKRVLYTAVHPLAVLLLRSGVRRPALEEWQEQNGAFMVERPVLWWRPLLADKSLHGYTSLAVTFGMTPADVDLWCALVESAPFARGALALRRWGRGSFAESNGVPPAPDDIALEWDRSIRAELGDFYRRVVASAEVLHG